jgi:hypothetical protein
MSSTLKQLVLINQSGAQSLNLNSKLVGGK